MELNLESLLPVLMQNMGAKSKEELLASRLRGEEAMRSANDQAHALDLLAFASQGANNPALSKAVGGLSASQNSKYKPIAMGNTGFAIPGAGQFVENPAFVEEKQMQRVGQLQQALAAMQQRNEDSIRRGESAKESNALKMAIAAMANGTRQQQLEIQRMLAQAKLAESEVKAERAKGAKVTQLSTTLEKAGVPELMSAMSLAEGRLASHPEGELPGYGRVESLLPNGMSTEEMQLARQDLQTAANIMLKARSGSAVTDSESRRFLTELGQGKGMTEKAIREGFRKLRQHFDSKVGNILAGVDDEILDLYNERTINPLSRPTKKIESAPAKPQINLPSQDAIDAELARRGQPK